MSLVLQHPYAQALAWALIHFVWQGAAIALALVTIQHLGRFSASARYTTGVIAMAAMLVVPALTFVRLMSVAPAPQAPIGADALRTIAAAEARPASDTQAATISDTTSLLAARPAILTTLILVVWTAGVVVLSLRLLGGWLVARRLARRALSPASAEIQALARRVAGRLALDRVVSVFESSAVAVPMMIGWMKPVVLLPAAALSGLSMVQLEALLAHELAHVRRHDYLVNLLQSGVETLLFYHPAVWFVSRRARIDREHCCDDLAVDICDRVVYATALSDLAAMARTTPRVALAATDGPLLSRVRRILGQPAGPQDVGSGWLSVCVVVFLVGALAPAALTRGEQPTADQGGVATGVAGGVPGGVAGGVPGGVAGGVPGGVAGGVPGGVPGGVAGGAAEQRPVEREVPVEVAEARATQKRELAEKRRQLAEEQQKLQQAREENELRRNQSELTARLAELNGQYERLSEALSRMAKLRDNGGATESQLAELRAQLAAVEKQISAQRAELDFQQIDMDLRRKQRALELETVKAKLDREFGGTMSKQIAEDKVREEMSQRMLVESKLADLSQGVSKEDVMRQVEELKARADLEVTELGAEVTARAGDSVYVLIHNEPDLPKRYTVQSDGTIRFPFLGEIRVQGMTARDIQKILTKELADRKLASGSAVDVTLRGTRR